MAGDAALLLEFGDAIEEGTNDDVQGLRRQVAAAGLRGVLGAVPGYATLLLEYDPAIWEPEGLLAAVAGLAAREDSAPARRRHVIPVCYGGEFGPDLEGVARSLGLREDAVIRQHGGRDYHIYCVGFSPGFPYCGALPPSLQLPRRDAPRTRVPAGAVAIAGLQTGVYPRETSGGWHLIGRTPLELFRWDRDDPVPYEPGDAVRFRAIGEAAFEELRERSRSGEDLLESSAF